MHLSGDFNGRGGYFALRQVTFYGLRARARSLFAFEAFFRVAKTVFMRFLLER